ncbi:MAG: aa3-type cytochrome c oxidase subunit IV [Alsobacter sp.]|jgi:hypothetical protein|nr:aa3-type cytochrome c oxidase subunit IV [Burkholderiales bacterium]
MAQHDTSHGGHPAMDYPEHERTYAAFTAVTKWGTITIAAILVLMYIFLV